MDRRQLLIGSAGAAAAALVGGGASGLPKRDSVKVAFMLGENTNMIDTAGPWEVFQDVMLTGAGGMHNPFELFTVAPNLDDRRMTGGFLTMAQHRFADAPKPNVIVVPAHGGSPESLAWLKRASQDADVTMSVCTGAFQLARAGLLEGIPATTHHDYWDAFAREFPTIDLRRGPRFVDNGRIASAGGLTSGIDLALHIVHRYFGPETAAATAAYMEHGSDAWRTA